MNPPGIVLGVLWAQFGPYHFARVAAFARLTDSAKVHAIEFASQTRDYRWQRPSTGVSLTTLCPGSVTEELSFTAVFLRLRKKLSELGINVCLLPSYSPKQSFAALLAAKSLGIRVVMMNESHAGTASAGGFAAVLKRRLVNWFDAALVGGAPQKRYFASLGIPEEKIFTGYDAVDNEYFARRAEEVRSQKSETRGRHDLPEHYFLSLGRFVPKKNLTTLIKAYRKFLNASPEAKTHLVMVGSGEEDSTLRRLCAELDLPIYNHAPQAARFPTSRAPGVHFYGFRQIDENPVFYGLADAFILPSVKEEWGLVVNEAMASGLPVIVSETVGCAEDLLDAVKWDDVFPQSAGPQLARLGLRHRLRANGLVFDPNSSDELSQALLLLESSAELRNAMGQASRRIVDRFSCDNFAKNALLAAQTALTQNSRGRLPVATSQDQC
jgi:1,2-diacylglycerol 3-alpha-glucosyltransferase